MLMGLNLERVRSVGHTLSYIGWDGLVVLDSYDYVFKFLRNFIGSSGDLRPVMVVTLGATVINYQLGRGGPREFWRVLDSLLRERGYRIASLEEAEEVLRVFMRKPINFKLRSVKLSRIRKFIDSGLSRYLWESGYRVYSERPEEVMSAILKSVGPGSEGRTLSQVMRVLDLTSLIERGRYANFRNYSWLQVPSHVADLALYSGIVDLSGTPERTNPSSILYLAKHLFISAWSEVAKMMSRELNERVTTVRVFELLNQLGGERVKVVHSRSSFIKSVVKAIVSKVGVPKNVALAIASELAYRMR